MRILQALAFLLILTGCGGGGGGGGGSGGGSPPPPPPPPPPVVDQYDAAWSSRTGTLATQGDTSVEFTADDGHILFVSVLGTVSINTTGSSTGWRGQVTLGGVLHSVWFWPEQDHLSLTETATPGNNVTWTVTLLAGGG